MLSESVTRLIDELAKLPGIGKKSAERIAYHLLRIHKTEALGLADAIRNVKENVRYCNTCTRVCITSCSVAWPRWKESVPTN
jgi:recombination protein RecR